MEREGRRGSGGGEKFYKDWGLQTRLPCLLKSPRFGVAFSTSNLVHMNVKGACPPSSHIPSATKIENQLRDWKIISFLWSPMSVAEKGKPRITTCAFCFTQENKNIYYIALSHIPGFLQFFSLR